MRIVHEFANTDLEKVAEEEEKEEEEKEEEEDEDNEEEEDEEEEKEEPRLAAALLTFCQTFYIFESATEDRTIVLPHWEGKWLVEAKPIPWERIILRRFRMDCGSVGSLLCHPTDYESEFGFKYSKELFLFEPGLKLVWSEIGVFFLRAINVWEGCMRDDMGVLRKNAEISYEESTEFVELVIAARCLENLYENSRCQDGVTLVKQMVETKAVNDRKAALEARDVKEDDDLSDEC
jgi:hypothetical protein